MANGRIERLFGTLKRKLDLWEVARLDPYANPVRREFWFEAWDGLLQGYYLRR